MAENVRSRVTAEGGEARGACLFGGLKPCHYDMYTEIRFDFSIWQVAERILGRLKRKVYLGKLEFVRFQGYYLKSEIECKGLKRIAPQKAS